MRKEEAEATILVVLDKMLLSSQVEIKMVIPRSSSSKALANSRTLVLALVNSRTLLLALVYNRTLLSTTIVRYR